jgi:predicted RNA-binding Zn-ribbon protein involved in translation (DUF1610 family)
MIDPEVVKMQCPHCQHEMVKGSVQVRGNWATFFWVGLSIQHLYFDHLGNQEVILGSRDKQDAFRCENCAGLFIPNSHAH